MTASRVVLMVFAIVAGIWDLRSRRIPNWLTLPALAIAFALRPDRESLFGLGVALAISLPLFALRSLGGGDVKLMAAVGAFTGPMVFVYIFLVNASLGGLVALGVVLTRGRLWKTLGNVGAILSDLARLRAPRLTIESREAVTIPRAAIFGAAVILVVVLTP